jgi:hypothetical protein
MLAWIKRLFRREPCAHDWYPRSYFWLEDILVGIDECAVCHAVMVRSQ